jgi:5-methylcytosine-specific restriction endonuclease McrA
MPIPSQQLDYAAINKMVEADFECLHEEKTVRKKLSSDGAISIWHQCDCCGHKIGPAVRKITLSSQQIEALSVWDECIVSRFNDEKQEHFIVILNREKERLKAVWWKSYEKYLASPEWKHKRKLVLERAQNTCEGCREAKAMDVHHLSYDDVGKEFLFQLVALCRKCHDRWHIGKVVSPSSIENA